MTIEKFAFEQVTSSAGTGDGWIIQCALFREPIAQHCGTKQKTPFSMRHRGLSKPDGLSLRRPSRPTLTEATFRPVAEPELCTSRASSAQSTGPHWQISEMATAR